MKKLITLLLLSLSSLCQAQVQWKELGTDHSLNSGGNIYSLARDNSGNIYATGKFQNASNCPFVAKYNGTTWAALGGTTLTTLQYATINKIVIDNSGNVYAAITPFSGGGACVAKWNGTSWTKLGATTFTPLGTLYSMVFDSAGNLFVGGLFNWENGSHIAKWDGTSWTSPGATGIESGGIRTLAADASGNVYAAGDLTLSGSPNTNVIKWNGTIWSKVGTPSGNTNISWTGTIYTLKTDASGNLYAAGTITNTSHNKIVVKWDGTNWTSVGDLNGNGDIRDIAINNTSGNIFAGGGLRNSTDYLYYVSQWNGSNWSEVGTGTNRLKAVAGIETILLDPSSNLYAGGAFYNTTAGNYVATTKVQLVTAITEKTNTLVSAMYPNPNNGLFSLELKEDAEVIVSDALGRTVQNQSVYAGNHSMNIEKEPQGLYIISIQNKKGQIQTLKFLKDK
jgi:hypothetical protein